MRFFRTPPILCYLMPGLTWRVRRPAPATVYLTFDDGPIPEETPWVLDQLAAHDTGAATFFCVGENLARHPAVARQVLVDGHRLANHTQHHLRGWRTPLPAYLADIAACQAELDVLQPGVSRLLRPPYGEISWPQIHAVKNDNYQVVMWSVLAYDFDPALSAADCLRQVIRYTRPGRIILFHDSRKASRLLRAVLPPYLDFLRTQGWRSAVLPG
ncbi:MAG: polysaccharide deacetylase family protein [Hymenobacteraceae bacterium]|nr:polysaccharide deacetylase family protein [Hymenobacteraceae bacterium]